MATAPLKPFVTAASPTCLPNYISFSLSLSLSFALSLSLSLYLSLFLSLSLSLSLCICLYRSLSLSLSRSLSLSLSLSVSLSLSPSVSLYFSLCVSLQMCSKRSEVLSPEALSESFGSFEFPQPSAGFWRVVLSLPSGGLEGHIFPIILCRCSDLCIGASGSGGPSTSTNPSSIQAPRVLSE